MPRPRARAGLPAAGRAARGAPRRPKGARAGLHGVRGDTVRSVPAPRRYATDAIVLSRFDYGEADRILTLLTPMSGKIKAIAKGIRRPTSRIGGSLEPFAELRLALAHGRTFDVVTQVEVIHPWLRLRDDLVSFGTASYMAEMADKTQEERHAAESIYLLLKRGYELLDAGMTPGRVARWFEMHLADELGIRPEVDRCVECARLLETDERYRWVPPLGGVLCARCPGPPQGIAGLSLEALKLLVKSKNTAQAPGLTAPQSADTSQP